MNTCDSATRPAEEAFRGLLEADPEGTRQELATVRDQLVQHGLLFNDGPLPLCFAPALITSGRVAPLRRQMDRLIRLLTRLEGQLRRPYWMNRLGIPTEEQELIMLDSGLPPGNYISRIDGFLGPPQGEDTGYRIVELNIDSPGGGAFMDTCARLMTRTPTWKRFIERFPGRYLPTSKLDLPLLLSAWEAWGGRHAPRVAIVDWVTVNTAAEFEVLKRSFIKRGVETVVADPRELTFRNGRLWDYDGRPIDLVYRRVLVEDILAHGEAARPLLSAYRAGAVCMVNPISCKPLTVKSLLALIHTSDFEPLLPAADLAFLRSLIPWTAAVEDGPVLDEISKRRRDLILKPADGYGGEGLYLGWQLGKAEWESGITQALAGRYVAQERVMIPQADFPTPAGRGWKYSPLRVDFAPYMFGRRFADPLVRMAASDVLNVKAGAQIAVTWILEQPGSAVQKKGSRTSD